MPATLAPSPTDLTGLSSEGQGRTGAGRGLSWTRARGWAEAGAPGSAGPRGCQGPGRAWLSPFARKGPPSSLDARGVGVDGRDCPDPRPGPRCWHGGLGAWRSGEGRARAARKSQPGLLLSGFIRLLRINSPFPTGTCGLGPGALPPREQGALSRRSRCGPSGSPIPSPCFPTAATCPPQASQGPSGGGAGACAPWQPPLVLGSRVPGRCSGRGRGCGRAGESLKVELD